MINNAKDAKIELSYDQLMKLLGKAGKYISATKSQITNNTSSYNALDRECNHYDVDITFIIREAKDYFARRPNSRYL